VAKCYFPGVSDIAQQMPKETNTAGDFAERLIKSNGMNFDFDINARGTG
jgi:hypothetical protein